LKFCKNCNQDKCIEDFHNYKPAKDGKYHICKICARARNKQYSKDNPEIIKQSNIRRYLKAKDKIDASNKAWAEANPEKRKTISRNWARAHKQETAIYRKKYKAENKGKVNAHTAKRRAAKLQATPKWLKEEDFQKIEQIYIKAKELEKEDGIPREVDHIIPLISDLVCGLHIAENLQILTAVENASKNNKILI
jgi:hypothetical protein